MAIFFYKEFGELGYLASYSNHGFYCDGLYWNTVEHYYQAQKFSDKHIQDMIRTSLTPKEASTIGRDKNLPLREDWDEIREQIMYDAVLYKFRNHKDIALKLINTGDECIIEDTVKENFWGCGPNKDGKNAFGRILCLVRENLKKEVFGMKKYYISKKGYDELYREYLDIDNQINITNRQIGESVKRDNDLRENPEFMQLRVKAMYELPHKKEELWNKYERAIIIEDTDEFKHFDESKVIVGCKVLLLIDDEEEEYFISGTDEGDIEKGIMSCSAPIAESIIGKKVGESIDFNNISIKILKTWL